MTQYSLLLSIRNAITTMNVYPYNGIEILTYYTRTVRVNETIMFSWHAYHYIVSLNMQSIQVGYTTVAEIKLQRGEKNIGSMRTKGVNAKILSQCTASHETLHCKNKDFNPCNGCIFISYYISHSTVASTVYIGIAMVFVFSPYISSYFQFQLLMTLQHRKCQNKIVYEVFHKNTTSSSY